MRRLLLSLVGVVLSAAVMAAQNAPVVAVRAGRLLDPEAGRILTGALKNMQFVMKDGQVFKQDGVMTPAVFCHGGPVNGWRIR